VGVATGFTVGTLKLVRIDRGPLTVRATSEVELDPLGRVQEVNGCADGFVAVTAKVAVSPQATGRVLTFRSSLYTVPAASAFTAPRRWLE
jgi:hypothetical protein